MKPVKDVINMIYSGEDILVLNSDGLVSTLHHKDLEYPYFYTEADLKDDTAIVSKEAKEVLYFNGKQYSRKKMYKISTRGAYDIPKLRKGSFTIAEADIPFLERRLGADGYVEYATIPKRYAYIDIEEIKGQIALIGVKAIIDGVKSPYYGFTEIADFVKYLLDNRITIILAWNGEAYDYKILEDYVAEMGKQDYRFRIWWDLMLKLDSMTIYSRYTQQKLMSLEKAAEIEGIEGKLTLSKSFNEIDVNNTADMDELKVYNERDVDVEMAVIEKRGVLKINMKIANNTGVAIHRVSAVPMFDNLILKKFHNTGVVLADSTMGEKAGIKGGYTGGAGEGGLFEDVVAFDANSLYPSIIINREFKGEYAEVWKIMKEFITYFLKERKRFKELYAKTKLEEYDTTQMMYKIFANSLYGALANVAFRFFSEEMAGFITEEGRKVAVKMREIIKDLGFLPVYGDSVVGNTLIHTDDGLEKIEDLFKEASLEERNKVTSEGKEIHLPKDKYVLAVDGSGKVGLDKVVKIIRHKTNKQVYRVWFTNVEYVDVSQDHSLLHIEKDKLVEFKPLERKTAAVVGRIERKYIRDEKLSPELYMLIGNFIADGYIKKGGYITLSTGNDTESMIEKLITPLQREGIIKESINYNKSRKGDISFSTNGFEDYFFACYEGKEKTIPDFIMEETKENIAKVLQGMFEGDGTVFRKDNPIVRYTTIYKNLAIRLKYLLGVIGISSMIFKENRENVFKGEREYSRHTYNYQVLVKDVEKFRELVGFISDRKNERLIGYKRKLKNLNDCFVERIQKIEPIEYDGYLYDIEVENNHTFIGNYVALHNTDSVFVANVHGKEYMLQDVINQKLYPLEVKVEKKYKKMLFLTNDDGKMTKKRYAGVDDSNKLHITGLEAIRSDWCDLARNTEKRVLEMLLLEGKKVKDVEKYLSDVITNIRSVPAKELAFVRSVDLTKKYDKDLRHVQVAKALGYYKTKRKLVFVTYLVGQKNTPIPVEEGENIDNYKPFIDYKYYIERQIKPPIKRILNTISKNQTKLTVLFPE